MGRHRPDPRGHARILIATLAVVLALALLVIGGLALFRVFTSESDGGGGPKASPQNGTTVRVTRSATRTSKTTTHTLALKVTGAPTRVIVSVPGGTDQVLLNQRLDTGEVRYFDQGPLDVAVANGSAVDIYIHGKRQPKGEQGQRTQYHVTES